tara:strand:- start:403 stop:594 length:192 start_codon:yes stop_codon:yes gene_type:complete
MEPSCEKVAQAIYEQKGQETPAGKHENAKFLQIYIHDLYHFIRHNHPLILILSEEKIKNEKRV